MSTSQARKTQKAQRQRMRKEPDIQQISPFYVMRATLYIHKATHLDTSLNWTSTPITRAPPSIERVLKVRWFRQELFRGHEQNRTSAGLSRLLVTSKTGCYQSSLFIAVWAVTSVSISCMNVVLQDRCSPVTISSPLLFPICIIQTSNKRLRRLQAAVVYKHFSLSISRRRLSSLSFSIDRSC